MSEMIPGSIDDRLHKAVMAFYFNDAIPDRMIADFKAAINDNPSDPLYQLSQTFIVLHDRLERRWADMRGGHYQQNTPTFQVPRTRESSEVERGPRVAPQFAKSEPVDTGYPTEGHEESPSNGDPGTPRDSPENSTMPSSAGSLSGKKRKRNSGAEQETTPIPINLRAVAGKIIAELWAPAQSSLNAVAPTAKSLRSSDTAKRTRERSELEESTVKKRKESAKKADHRASASRESSVASKAGDKENRKETAPSPNEKGLPKSRVPGLHVCPFCKVKLPQRDCDATKYTNHILKAHPDLPGTFLACSNEKCDKMRFRLGDTAMQHMNLATSCGGHLVAKHNPASTQNGRGRQPQTFGGGANK